MGKENKGKVKNEQVRLKKENKPSHMLIVVLFFLSL
jgi:hypothetical protein